MLKNLKHFDSLSQHISTISIGWHLLFTYLNDPRSPASFVLKSLRLDHQILMKFKTWTSLKRPSVQDFPAKSQVIYALLLTVSLCLLQLAMLLVNFSLDPVYFNNLTWHLITPNAAINSRPIIDTLYQAHLPNGYAKPTFMAKNINQLTHYLVSML